MELWDPRAVEMACAGLAILGVARLPLSATRPVPKDLVPLLGQAEPLVRWSAARLLDRLGSVDPAVLAALRAATALPAGGPASGRGASSPISPEVAAAAAARALAHLSAPATDTSATADEVLAALAEASRGIMDLDRVTACSPGPGLGAPRRCRPWSSG